MKKLKNDTKLTIFQAFSFLSACTLAVIWFGWKLIPILILFGWSNNVGILKSIKKEIKEDTTNE